MCIKNRPMSVVFDTRLRAWRTRSNQGHLLGRKTFSYRQYQSVEELQQMCDCVCCCEWSMRSCRYMVYRTCHIIWTWEPWHWPRNWRRNRTTMRLWDSRDSSASCLKSVLFVYFAYLLTCYTHQCSGMSSVRSLKLYWRCKRNHFPTSTLDHGRTDGLTGCNA